MNKISSFKKSSNNHMDHTIKEAGITLVALVVTIIVLLILAGIALGTILGQDGLMQRAKDTTAVWENTSANESAKMAEVSAKIDEYINTPSGPVYWGNGENKKEAGIYIHSTGELVETWATMNKVGATEWSGDIYELSGGVYCTINWDDNVWLTDGSQVGSGYVLNALWEDRDSPNYISDYSYDLVLPEGIVAFARSFCYSDAFEGENAQPCHGLNTIYLPSTFKGIMGDGSALDDDDFAYECEGLRSINCLGPAPYFDYFEEILDYYSIELTYVNDN